MLKFVCQSVSSAISEIVYAKTAFVFWGIICTLQTNVSGVSLPQCAGTPPAIELKEGVAGQTITCLGTGSTQQVVWNFEGSTFATCNAPSDCDTSFGGLVTPTRDDSSSTLTFPGATSRSVLGNKTINCTLAGTSLQFSRCIVDVIYTAEKPTCSISYKHNIGPKLIGVCTIKRAFSSIGRYDCLWLQRHGNAQATQIPEDKTSVTSPAMIPDTDSKPYYSFNCSFEVSLPVEAGLYNYTVSVQPGSVATSSTYDITIPSLQHDCPTDYQRVGNTVTCTCSAVTPGSPVADVSWENTNSNRLSLTLTSQHNNRQFTCQAKWGTRVVTSTSFKLRVAYGPNSVTVTGPPKPLDTNGRTSMTLFCNTSASNPSQLNYTWRRLPGTTVGSNQSTIILTASEDLDEKQIQCTASNSQFSDISVVGTYTVSLNYPPTSAPVISNYNTGDVLYADDVLTMTCTVTGGKPVANTSVIFSCGSSKQDDSDGISGNDVNSNLEFNPIVAANHGLYCECTARWKNYSDWYTQRQHVNLTVYSSPSAPNISTPNTSYPFIAGVTRSARVTCISRTPGVPPVSYTWTQTAGGQPGSDGTLTFDTVTRDLHNRTVSCRASNAFTEDKNRPLSEASLSLDVYFHPAINISPSVSSCRSMSNETHCDVMEQENVTLTCNSHSNPDPVSTRWYRGAPGGSPVTPDPVLRVTSASHVTDNGVYSCQSTTGALAYNHPPLTSTHRLLLLVLYSTSQLNVTLNNNTANLTVSERDHVTVTCAANGRPTPSLQLYSRAGQEEKLLGSVEGGEKVLEDRVTSLNHVITSAECPHTAAYRCKAGNDVKDGGRKEEGLQLYVQCAPHQNKTTDDVPKYNYNGQPFQLSVDLIAFPLPHNITFVFKGPANNLSETVTSGKLESDCWATSRAYLIRCNITIDTFTNEDAGFYSANITNSVGSNPFVFEVTYKESTVLPLNPDNGAGDVSLLIGSVIAAVVVSVVVVLVVGFFIRRTRQKQQGSQEHISRSREREVRSTDASDDEIVIVNDIYDRTGNYDDEVMVVNDIYEGADNVEKDQQCRGAVRNDYEDVDVASLKPKVKPKPVTGGKLIHPGGDNAYPVVEKAEPLQAHSSIKPDDNLYARVDKSKKASDNKQNITSGADSTKPKQKTSNPTQQKPPKPKKNKQKPKKEKGKGSQNGEGDAVYGNTPLSMKPVDNTVYENYAFQKDESDHSRDQARALGGSENCTTNPDGLVYTTIAFTQEQQKKARKPPPGRETTEYVDIDFTRRAPSVSND